MTLESLEIQFERRPRAYLPGSSAMTIPAWTGRYDVAEPLMRTKRKRGKMRLRDHNRTSAENGAGGGLERCRQGRGR